MATIACFFHFLSALEFKGSKLYTTKLGKKDTKNIFTDP